MLIAVAAFYRSRRLREIEEAHPFTRTRNRNETRVATSRSAPNERQHLMPFTLPAPTSPHHDRGKSSSAPLGAIPFDLLRPSHHQSNPENQDQRREERRLELNNRLEAVTSRMRSLKTSYAQDQTRLQYALQRQRRQGQNMYFERNGNTTNASNSDPPLVAGGAPPAAGSMTAGGTGFAPPSNSDHPPALVPVRMPVPITPAVEDRSSGEPMVNPYVLADMRTQMGIMMDQIQYLRAQQNTPYLQGLTDEPPPGYMDVIGSYHRSP